MKKEVSAACLLIVAVCLGVLAVGVSPAAADADRARAMAEPPEWPMGWQLEPPLGPEDRPGHHDDADILVWVPPEAERIRAIMLIPNNTDSKHVGEHEPLHEVAKKHEMGIVYKRRFDTGIEWDVDEPDRDRMPDLLADVAERTGIEQFRHAPWITFGKSSRGTFPFHSAWIYPERTIAGVTYHGQVPNFPIADWGGGVDQSILYVNINGESEWDRTWYRHVRPMMLNYRKHTRWLPHQVVLDGIGHGNYPDMHGSDGWGEPVPEGEISCLRVWDYVALFVDKALELRLPEEGDPADGPLELRQVDPDSGYLVHPRAPEVLLGNRWRPLRKDDDRYTIVDHREEPGEVFAEEQGEVDPEKLIRPASEVPQAERESLLWIADRELVDAWLELHNVEELDLELGQSD